MEFMDDPVGKSMIPLLREGKNVIVARTFSKIHGMAGMRIGYIVAQKETLKKLKDVTRAGMGITQTSIDAAITSMDDQAFLAKSRRLNSETRQFVFNSLESMGIDYVKSQTSFVLFPIDLEGKTFLDRMYSKGVAVRAFKIHGKNYCRVSMGTMEEMRIFFSTLKDVIS